MTTLTRNAAARNPGTAPAAKLTAPRRKPFGWGLAARPQVDNTAKVRPYSDDDAAWWAAESARLAEEEAEADGLDAMLNEMHEEREVARFMEAGLGVW